MSPLVDLEPLVLGEEPVVARVVQMPLAGEEGPVTGFLERLGDGDLLERQVVQIARGRSLRAFLALPRNPVGDPDPHRILAGQQRGARRGTHRMGRISLRESHRRGGKLVERRGLVKRRSVTTQVVVAQVIDQDHHNVRPRFRLRHHRQHRHHHRRTDPEKQFRSFHGPSLTTCGAASRSVPTRTFQGPRVNFSRARASKRNILTFGGRLVFSGSSYEKTTLFGPMAPGGGGFREVG